MAKALRIGKNNSFDMCNSVVVTLGAGKSIDGMKAFASISIGCATWSCKLKLKMPFKEAMTALVITPRRPVDQKRSCIMIPTEVKKLYSLLLLSNRFSLLVCAACGLQCFRETVVVERWVGKHYRRSHGMIAEFFVVSSPSSSQDTIASALHLVCNFSNAVLNRAQK
ncbi:unnamed protein product [Phytophthora fragariaefolia]|uniref:Unnamed protein product n=1 Tax=Phytophthora fragariaefolia TaxID=1490495 RepID=A0A9W6YCV1_9STRA|nr:unnamed protein product [Phytophthora fragariaefolia]